MSLRVNGVAAGSGGGSVASTDISDSTATGRSVLTGDAAAGLSALGAAALATSGTPAALGTADRGTDATAARSDHVHPTTNLGRLDANQNWSGTNNWTRDGYQLLGLEPASGQRNIGVFNAPPTGQQVSTTVPTDPTVTELRNGLIALGWFRGTA